MNKQFRRHLISVICGSILGIAIAAAYWSMLYTAKAGNSPDKSSAALHMFAGAIDKVRSTGYKETEFKTLVYSGIHGMLRTLDPYSQFLEEDAFKYMHEQQEGIFYGIGISFDIRNGELLVVAPIEGSPAWRLGMRAGDVIVEIDGQSAAGITTADVIKKLRGEKHSKVTIKVKRPSVSDLLEFEIIRDKIALNSVRGGFMLPTGIGYVRITEFSSTTGEELITMLRELKKQNMKGLILDLRFNGGGLLSAAEDVSSLFLKKGDLIVSTKGRNPNADMEISNRRDGSFAELPLIVLVNRNSASSSEIVAGCIQDHDRGLVLGTSTHGKGLVGSQFSTLNATAAQITTAQYFTPSGRFIQRPYDIPHRKISEKDKDQIPDQSQPAYKTEKGRKVFGGGGINPDVVIEDNPISHNLFLLENSGTFFDFAVKKGTAWADKLPDIEIDRQIMDAFWEFCHEKDIDLQKTDIDSDLPDIRLGIKRELLSVYTHPDEGEKLRVSNLKQVRKALDLFPYLDQILAGSYSVEEESAVAENEIAAKK